LKTDELVSLLAAGVEPIDARWTTRRYGLEAAGSVGACAVQLVRYHRATGIAVISSDKGDLVRALGAAGVIDWRQQAHQDAEAPLTESVDVVIDAAGGDLQRRALATLRRGGMLVSAVSAPDPALLNRYGVKGRFFLVNVSTECLESISALIEVGELSVKVGTVMPLADARLAHEMLEGARARPRGKIVLKNPSNPS
jgi:NADPH:quinone reductase-like Zn-dependent oxidoreductase